MGVVQGSIPCKSNFLRSSRSGCVAVVVVDGIVRGLLVFFVGCGVVPGLDALSELASPRQPLASNPKLLQAQTSRRDEQGAAEVDNVATPHSTCLVVPAHDVSHWCIPPGPSSCYDHLTHQYCSATYALMVMPYLPQRRCPDASWIATIGTQPSRAWTPVDDRWTENVSFYSHVCAFAQCI
jgi:hypothetical protein